MAIHISDEGIKLSNSDAFWYRLENDSKENYRAYSFVKAILGAIFRNIELKGDISSHMQGDLGETLTKRISDWKITIPFALPFTRETLEMRAAPYLEESPKAKELSRYLDTLVHEMKYRGLGPEHTISRLIDLNNLTFEFEKESEQMPESWYRCELVNGLPQLVLRGFPPGHKEHSPDHDVCLKKSRLECAQDLRATIVSAAIEVLRKVDTLLLPVDGNLPRGDNSESGVSASERWQSMAKSYHNLIGQQPFPLEGKKLDFHNRLTALK